MTSQMLSFLVLAVLLLGLVFGLGLARRSDQEQAPSRHVHWLLQMLWWVFVMGLGAGYGIVGYKLFDQLFSSPGEGKSGVMQLSFLAGIPLVVGALVVYLVQLQRKLSFWQAMSLSGVPVLLLVFLAGTLLREGFVCILLALPLLLAVAAVGAFLGWIARTWSRDRSRKTLSVALVLPFLLGTLEQKLVPPDAVRTVNRSIHIHAAPATVWALVNCPTDIRPAELGSGIAYRIGVPYPIEARTLDPRLGGLRKLKWQRGVTFDEQIIGWEENRYIAWKYLFRPDSFPPGSLDDHIRLGGQYFDLVDTSYTLTPEPGGTRLDVRVSFKVSTDFNWYAGAWGRFLIADTAQAILGFYKHRAEAAPPSAS